MLWASMPCERSPLVVRVVPSRVVMPTNSAEPPLPPDPPMATAAPAPTETPLPPLPPPPPMLCAKRAFESCRCVVTELLSTSIDTLPPLPPPPPLAPTVNQPPVDPPLPPPPPMLWATMPCEQPVPQVGSGPALPDGPRPVTIVADTLLTVMSPPFDVALPPPPNATMPPVEPPSPPVPPMLCAWMPWASLP